MVWSHRREKLVLPEIFIQHQQYLDRRMLQFWALRPSITESSLTLSLELSVSSMASASFYKEHERNPSKSNRDILTSDTHSSFIFSVYVHTHARTHACTHIHTQAKLRWWGREHREVVELKRRAKIELTKGNSKKSWPPTLEKAVFEEQSASLSWRC